MLKVQIPAFSAWGAGALTGAAAVIGSLLLPASAAGGRPGVQRVHGFAACVRLAAFVPPGIRAAGLALISIGVALVRSSHAEQRLSHGLGVP